VEGDEETKTEGLFQLVRNHQTSDSLRSYQCIKTLVNASSKSHEVKEYLLQAPDRWQWAVNWLKNKMSDEDEATSSSSPYWSSSTGGVSGSTKMAPDVLSNEDASIRTFHRTTSARVTLDEAKAILAEFDGSLPTAVEADPGNNGDGGSGNKPVGMETGEDEDEDTEMPDLQEIRPKE